MYELMYVCMYASLCVYVGMVFNLAVGFQNVPLSAEDKSSAPSSSPMHKLDHFSMLLADVVAVQKEVAILKLQNSSVTFSRTS